MEDVDLTAGQLKAQFRRDFEDLRNVCDALMQMHVLGDDTNVVCTCVQM